MFLGSAAAAAASLQSCPTLCDPIDGSPPGSPVPGILQARTLEWAAISFSRDCFKNTMHAIDFLPRNMQVAKYTSKNLHNFRSFWVFLRPTLGLGSAEPILTSSATAAPGPLSCQCSGSVTSKSMGWTLVNQGESSVCVAFFFVDLFIYLAAPGPCRCVWVFSHCGEQGLLLAAMCGLLIAVTALVVEHGLQVLGLSYSTACGPGIELVSPALTGDFLNRRIIALHYCACFCPRSAWISRTYTPVPSLLNPFPTSHPASCHGALALSSLHHAVNAHWLSLLQLLIPIFSATLSIRPALSFPHCVHKSVVYGRWILNDWTTREILSGYLLRPLALPVLSVLWVFAGWSVFVRRPQGTGEERERWCVWVSGKN